MAHTVDYSEPSTTFYTNLIEAIKRPEPICLLLIEIDLQKTLQSIHQTQPLTTEIQESLSEAIIYAVKNRVSSDLRTYDFLSRVEKFVLAAALRTLASEEELQKRVADITNRLNQPYTIHETEISVKIKVGNAIRKTGERPSSLLRRADSKIETQTTKVSPPSAYRKQ